MILNHDIETMSQSEKETLQTQKFQKLMECLYEKTYFYQSQLEALGLTPADFKSIQDIQQLPFTTFSDLTTHYPFGFLTMPISGTARFEQVDTAPIASGFTSQDLVYQQEIIARSLVACYITTTSVLLSLPAPKAQVSTRSLEQSAEMLGITVIAAQAATLEEQLKAILDFGVTTLFAMPEQLFEFADFLVKKGVKKQDLPLMNILCETQPCPTNFQQELMKKFELPVYTLYGQPEIMSIGIGGECYLKQGLHIHDDHFYPEIINPQTGEVVAEHTPGELVLTTLSREATPLLRYRTGKKALLTHERCTCGRTSARLHFI